MTELDFSQKSGLLQAFRDLSGSAAWQEIETLIGEALREHLDGVTAQGRAHELRAEHIEAYHLAERLAYYRERRIAGLKEELRAHSRDVRELGAEPGGPLAE